MLQKTSAPNSRLIILSAWLYSKLLYLGPAEFRRAYGRHMLQTVVMCWQEAYQRAGWCGVIILWPALFTELIEGLLAEHITVMCPPQKLGHVYIQSAALWCLFALGGLGSFVFARYPGLLPMSDTVTWYIYQCFRLLRMGGHIVFLFFLLCGLSFVVVAGKLIFAERRRDILEFLTATIGSALLGTLISFRFLGAYTTSELVGWCYSLLVVLCVLAISGVGICGALKCRKQAANMLFSTLFTISLYTVALGAALVATVGLMAWVGVQGAATVSGNDVGTFANIVIALLAVVAVGSLVFILRRGFSVLRLF